MECNTGTIVLTVILTILSCGGLAIVYNIINCNIKEFRADILREARIQVLDKLRDVKAELRDYDIKGLSIKVDDLLDKQDALSDKQDADYHRAQADIMRLVRLISERLEDTNKVNTKDSNESK